MRAVNRIGLVLGAVGMLAACGPPRPGPAELGRLEIVARFGLENLCSGSRSPPIRVEGVPQDAAAYRIRVTNVTVLLQTPREWTIPAPGDPALIPFGALADWTGPCPGDTQFPRYRIETLALDRAGTPIAYGWTEATADPVNKQAQELWRQGRNGTVVDPTQPPPATPDSWPAARGDPFARDRSGGIFDRERGDPLNELLTPGLPQR